ncbi:MAG: AMP-binding protein [Pseudomonadota bacterium]
MSYVIDPDLLENMNLRKAKDPDVTGPYEIVIPERTNIATDTVGKYAKQFPDRLALVFEEADLSIRSWTFSELDGIASNLAQSLRELGVTRGDRVAIHTGLRPETGISHLAIYKLGAVAVTLSQLYGPDTLEHILNHAEAKAIITQDTAWDQYRGKLDRFPTLDEVIVVGQAREHETSFANCLSADGSALQPADTAADEPALLMYTSGSTGMPKGMLHGHRVLQSYIPSLTMAFNLDRDDPEAVFWSPADWAWVGGLLDALLIGWAFGHTVATAEHRFDPEWCFGFMARQKVTHTFLTPTALKRLAQIEQPASQWDLALRVIISGGEQLPAAVLNWAEDELGVVCNEFYGLTEVNHLIGCCKALYPARPGSMGLAYPGHGTTIVDDNGRELADGEVGEVVTRGDDATQFLGYWKDEAKSADLRLGGWLRTRDLALRDEDGYFWYRGRTDDLIKSAGYRIGPAEVEDCLARHPAIAEAAVIGSPDAERGAIVKAFVRLVAGVEGSAELTEELQAHVKSRLAAYKYPREIEYVDDMETTTSGKLNRKLLRELEEQRKGKF